jgi:6-pyruvoyltetrahydropterin/6-carboxytetrahydropterin synthase
MPQCGEGGSAVRVSILSPGLQDHLFVPVITGKPRSRLGRGFSLFGKYALTGIRFGESRGRRVAEVVNYGTHINFPPFNDHMPVVTVTRLLHFNAAHRVHNPALSEEENSRLFGKCNNPNWHGHNYRLEVSVRGAIDPRTGYVMDLGTLRELVEREVISRTDHRNFNIDVDYMHGTIPTTENIVVAMWRLLEPVVAPAKLVRLRLWETDNNYVDYGGE